jgi:hypothetical protein
MPITHASNKYIDKHTFTYYTGTEINGGCTEAFSDIYGCIKRTTWQSNFQETILHLSKLKNGRDIHLLLVLNFVRPSEVIQDMFSV